jgi:hypothetical protein
MRRKKETRIPIKPSVKKYIIEKCGNRCEYCYNFHIQQIHHRDEDPSNNDMNNLMGVCYECHRLIHGDKERKKRRLLDYGVPVTVRLTRQQVMEYNNHIDSLDYLNHNQRIKKQQCLTCTNDATCESWCNRCFLNKGLE